jgi:hypothetical protein
VRRAGESARLTMYERHEVYERMAANIVVQWAEGLFSLELVHGARKREREREKRLFTAGACCGLRVVACERPAVLSAV